MNPHTVGREAAESSDDEFHVPTAKRQKRHKFKTFAQKIKEVRINNIKIHSITAPCPCID